MESLKGGFYRHGRIGGFYGCEIPPYRGETGILIAHRDMHIPRITSLIGQRECSEERSADCSDGVILGNPCGSPTNFDQ